MTEDSQIHLAVLSDDFGMCSAVNEGIVQAFTQGLLTDANLMAPCPAFPEAVRLARQHGVPVGLHATFTAEWDYLRWKPLTSLPSMVQTDGTFYTTVEEAWEKADRREAETELEAQWNRIESEKLKITHICEHMGADALGQLSTLLRSFIGKKRTPYRSFPQDGKKHGIPHYRYDSVFASSGLSADRQAVKEQLKDWLHSIGPGFHLWATHCAMDHPSLEQMCKPTHVSFPWARTYRVIDQSLVMDPEVREWVEKRGIRRLSMAHCPVAGF